MAPTPSNPSTTPRRERPSHCTDDEKSAAEREEQEKDFAGLLAWLTETLSDHVTQVRLSSG
jgi:HSP90 family molecular chaperone